MSYAFGCLSIYMYFLYLGLRNSSYGKLSLLSLSGLSRPVSCIGVNPGAWGCRDLPDFGMGKYVPKW